MESGVTYEAEGTRSAPDHKVIYRSDTHAPLSVVGRGFKLVQPVEILEFFRDITALGGMKLHTAGALNGGRKIWALARNGVQGEVVPGDSVRGNLLLATAADGSLATTCMLTSVRVVCANTLRVALGDKSQGGAIKVSHRSTFNADSVKRQLGAVNGAFNEYLERMRALAQKSVTPEQGRELLNELLGKPAAIPEPEVSGEELLRNLLGGVPTAPAAKPDNKEPRAVDKVLRLFEGAGKGAMAEGVRGTAWGLLNAMTEYVDHDLGRTDDSRLNSAWFGRGDAMKSEFAQLLERV
jgi:phage/plasmid-like protein (TIGR03299 family)